MSKVLTDTAGDRLHGLLQVQMLQFYRRTVQKKLQQPGSRKVQNPFTVSDLGH